MRKNHHLLQNFQRGNQSRRNKKSRPFISNLRAEEFSLNMVLKKAHSCWFASKQWGFVQDEVSSLFHQMVLEKRDLGYHHRLHRPEFEQAQEVGDGQGSLACCCCWGLKESDRTERRNWTEILCSRWVASTLSDSDAVSWSKWSLRFLPSPGFYDSHIESLMVFKTILWVSGKQKKEVTLLIFLDEAKV